MKPKPVVSHTRADADIREAVARYLDAGVADVALTSGAAAASLPHPLPLAIRIVYCTALRGHALVETRDVDFDGLADVQFFAKT